MEEFDSDQLSSSDERLLEVLLSTSSIHGPQRGKFMSACCGRTVASKSVMLHGSCAMCCIAASYCTLSFLGSRSRDFA